MKLVNRCNLVDLCNGRQSSLVLWITDPSSMASLTTLVMAMVRRNLQSDLRLRLLVGVALGLEFSWKEVHQLHKLIRNLLLGLQPKLQQLLLTRQLQHQLQRQEGRERRKEMRRKVEARVRREEEPRRKVVPKLLEVLLEVMEKARRTEDGVLDLMERARYVVFVCPVGGAGEETHPDEDIFSLHVNVKNSFALCAAMYSYCLRVVWSPSLSPLLLLFPSCPRLDSSHPPQPAATAEEGDNSVAVPSSWGGRPTFANVRHPPPLPSPPPPLTDPQVLKQQEEAAAAEAAAAAGTPSNPAPTASAAPAPASKKPAASQHPNPSGNRPQGGGHKNQDKGGAPKSQSPAGGASGAATGAASKKLMTNPDGTWVRDKLPPR
jgi:hypothetical protein